MEYQGQGTTQAVLVTDTGYDTNKVSQRIALFDTDGALVEFSSLDVTGADVPLTGMVAGADEAVAATDTVNEAIAKLQAQVTALAARVTALETP